MMDAKSLSLGDFHLGISALDKIVGHGKNRYQEPDKGTYRHWKLILSQSKSQTTSTLKGTTRQ
jgi:hypothetical protein